MAMFTKFKTAVLICIFFKFTFVFQNLREDEDSQAASVEYPGDVFM